MQSFERLAESLGTLQAHGAIHLVITALCLVVVIGQGLVLSWVFLRPTPMHFVGRAGPGLSTPNDLTEDAVDFATRWLEVRYSFTPSTLAKRQETIRGWIDPRLFAKYDLECEKEKKVVKEASLSSETVVVEAAVVKKRGAGVLVHLEARRTVSLGDRRLPETPFRADLVLIPFPVGGSATKIVVFDVATDPPLSASPN